MKYLFDCQRIYRRKMELTTMKPYRRSSNIYREMLLVGRLLYLTIILILILPNSQINAHVTNTTQLNAPAHFYKGSKYTIDELINGKFTYKVSNDIDLDPCKASAYNLYNYSFFFLFSINKLIFLFKHKKTKLD